MQEKIRLSGVPETMLQTVYARARESGGRGVIRDRKAEELVEKLDYDFSLAEKDAPMRSGVIARTLVLDRLAALLPGFRLVEEHSLTEGMAVFASIYKVLDKLPAVRNISNRIVVLERA